MKLAFVVQRYGLEVNGGAELLCRQVAEHLSKYFDVEVITTCAIDYMTWKNEYKTGKDVVNGITAWRFPVDTPRNIDGFNKFSEKIFGKYHTKEEEIQWMKLQGPYSTKLFEFIEKNKEKYGYFIFFTYLYCTTFLGLPLVKKKAILVPTAHDEPPIYLEIFKELFSLPKAIIYNTEEEKQFVNSKFNNAHILSDVAGVGMDLPKGMQPVNFREKYNIHDNFIIYIGRIDESKGCKELFDYFLRYKKGTESNIKLVLLGKTVMKIPKHKGIIPLGFVSEEDKFNGVAASELLIMPSIYESLSMVLMEAWVCKKAVLVNGQCEVLKGHCLRSNAGVWYENYDEFKECLDLLLSNGELREKMGENGKKYVKENYSWDKVEGKYLRLLEKVDDMLEEFNVIFYGFRKTPYPNLGIAYLVSNLRKHQFNCNFQYLEAFDDINRASKEICKMNPDIVGLTACSVDFNNVKILSKKLKENCNPIILLGGSHISSVPQTLPTDVNIGFLGESEETIIAVFTLFKENCYTIEKLKKIKGIAFFDEQKQLQINERRPYQKNLDSFPRPARDIFSRDYWKGGVTSLLTSRGCPYHCSFCQVTSEWRVCRYHSAEYVVEEIQELVNNYDIHTFGIVDDLFIANKSRILKIIERLKEVGLLGKVHFAVNGRANLINEELVELLIKVGTVEIALGLESMSPKILPILKDKVTVAENIRAVDIVYKFGLKAGGLFMIGTPTETIEDMEITYDYVKENRHKFGGMQICITTPLPQTPLWDLCVKKGLINPDINQLDWDKLNISAEDIRTNLYVGDVDRHTFNKILHKFRKLFFQPSFVEQELSDKKNKLGLTKDLFKKGFSLRAFKLIFTDPLFSYEILINYMKLMKNRSDSVSNDEILYNLESSEINSEKSFQEGVSNELIRVQENNRKYFKLVKKAQCHLVGIFDEFTISYKTNDNIKYKKRVAIIKIGGNKIHLFNTNGKLEEITFPLHNNKEDKKRRVEIIYLELIEDKIEFLFNRIKADFVAIRNNYIEAGKNELEQVKSGIYPTETWPEGKGFWTNGILEGFLKPIGNETKIVLDFIPGKKADSKDNYKIEIELFDDKNGKILLKNKFEVVQSIRNKEILDIPSLNGIDVIKIVIKSDCFSPIDLNLSVDTRILGIAIKKIWLV